MHQYGWSPPLRMLMAIRTTKKIHFRLDVGRGGSTYLICWNGDRRKWSSFVCSWIEDVLYWLLTSLIVFFSNTKKNKHIQCWRQLQKIRPNRKNSKQQFLQQLYWRRVPWCRNFLHFVFLLVSMNQIFSRYSFFPDSKLLNNKF